MISTKSRLNVSKHLNKKCHQRFTTVFFRSLFDRDISVFVLITWASLISKKRIFKPNMSGKRHKSYFV